MSANRRGTPWVWVGLAGGCGLLMVCLCLAVVGSGALYVRWNGIALGPRSSAVNRIAYQGMDGNIHTIAPDGRDHRAVTTDGDGSELPQRFYILPNWSPDSRYLAYVRLARGAVGIDANLLASNLETGVAETLHAANGVGPFYLYWSPDSRQVAFLESAGQTIALRLGRLGATQAQDLANGAPFYFDWSPDSSQLLSHVNGSRELSAKAHVGLLRPGEVGGRSLSEDPSTFLSPDWSPDGRTLLFARRAGDGGEVVAADAGGGPARSVLPFFGSVSFAWSPTGEQIAYIVTDEPEMQGLGQIAYGRLLVTDATGGGLRTLADEQALAFFWSPDGRQIAYLTLTRNNQGTLRNDLIAQDDQVRLRWSVVAVATGEARSLTTFVPADGFASFIPFFDQYARSLQIWSPDSRSLVYSVAESDTHDAVYVIDVAPGATPRRLADGSVGVWSPR